MSCFLVFLHLSQLKQCQTVLNEVHSRNFQGLPGIDGKDGTPGIPGIKVRLTRGCHDRKLDGAGNNFFCFPCSHFHLLAGWTRPSWDARFSWASGNSGE